LLQESVREKIDVCNTEYAIAVERANTHSAERDTARLKDERLSNKHRASWDQKLTKISLTAA